MTEVIKEWRFQFTWVMSILYAENDFHEWATQRKKATLELSKQMTREVIIIYRYVRLEYNEMNMYFIVQGLGL